jgi:hypothetical protein
MLTGCAPTRRDLFENENILNERGALSHIGYLPSPALYNDMMKIFWSTCTAYAWPTRENDLPLSIVR